MSETTYSLYFHNTITVLWIIRYYPQYGIQIKDRALLLYSQKLLSSYKIIFLKNKIKDPKRYICIDFMWKVTYHKYQFSIVNQEMKEVYY